MNLQDFPRPEGDNGRGMHGSASTHHTDIHRWVRELRELNVKWYKLLDDGGGSSQAFCEALLAVGIMPIVRLYREKPNPGHLGGREKDTVRRLIGVGVRYFETNNEPNLKGEWKPGEWDKGAQPDRVCEHWVQDAEFVLDAGGYPLTPALSPGGHYDDMAFFDTMMRWLSQKGYGRLFERGACIGLHNYWLNHPFEYPYDPRNQQDHPGQTIDQDSNCFLKFIAYRNIFYRYFKFEVPILTTEGGLVVGCGDDNRYPRITTELHRERTMKQFLYMIQDTMDVPGLPKRAPDYYFCTADWLLGNFVMGHTNPAWEGQAWYSEQWPGGRLPTVDAVKAMPSFPRPPIVLEGESVIKGTVTGDGGGLKVTLRRDGQEVAITTTDAQGGYQFTQLPAGIYSLEVEGVGVVKTGIELDGKRKKTINITLPPRQSVVRGTVYDTDGVKQAGLAVTLRSAVLTRTTTTNAEGEYEFTDLGPGTYSLEVKGVVKTGIQLDGQNTEVVDITITGAPPREWDPRLDEYKVSLVEAEVEPGQDYWRLIKAQFNWVDEHNTPPFTGDHHVYYVVLDREGNPLPGVTVLQGWPDGQATAVTGSADPWIGIANIAIWAGYFPDQGPGPYSAWVDGLPSDKVVGMGLPARHHVSFILTFQRATSGVAVARSVVRGTITGGTEGLQVTLRRDDVTHTTTLTAAGQYEFTALPKGIYSLEIEGVGVVKTAISLDGMNTVVFDFLMASIIKGTVSGGQAGQKVTLHSDTWGWDRESSLDGQGRYEFTSLPAGTYTLKVADVVRSGIQVNGTDTATVDIALIVNQSKIKGTVTDTEGNKVAAAEVILRSATLSRSTVTDAQGRYEFSALPAGTYSIQVGTVMKSDIQLDGTNTVTVDLTVSPTAPTKVIYHYLLFGAPEAIGTETNVLIALSQGYVSKFGPTLGFSLTEAEKAEHVTIVGSTEAISTADEQRLKDADCHVERIDGDSYEVERVFDQLVAQGKRFLSG